MTDQVVYIVDDDASARASVAALVQAHGGQPVAFESAEQFLESVDFAQAGCVVVDVRMKGISGLQLQQRLAELGVPLPVIVITGYADVPMAVQAMRAGAISFLEKPCNSDELWRNIRLGLEREISERELRRRKAAAEAALADLSEAEVQVMQKILEGLPNKRIARELDIGLRTVELRRSTLMKKFHVASLAELVRLALLVEFDARLAGER